MSPNSFPLWVRKLAVFNLGFTVLVILWGALVRKTHSGAGCGDHWPLCNGEIVPLAPEWETIIEFTHRLTSGLALIGVVVTWFAVRRFSERGHPARRYATGSLVVMILEALLGAGLVIFGLVESNDSVTRAIVIAVHLANTFVLLAFMMLTTLVLTTGRAPELRQHFAHRARGAFVLGFGAILILIGSLGAISALGNTLFPPETLTGGMTRHLSGATHFLMRLKIIHPLVAIFGSLSLVGVIQYRLASESDNSLQSERTHRIGWLVSGLILLNVVIGAFDVVLLAPTWLSLTHLLFADLIWLAFVWYVYEWAGESVLQREPSEIPKVASATLL